MPAAAVTEPPNGDNPHWRYVRLPPNSGFGNKPAHDLPPQTCWAHGAGPGREIRGRAPHGATPSRNPRELV